MNAGGREPILLGSTPLPRHRFFDLWFQRSLGNVMFPYQAEIIERIIGRSEPLIINKSRKTGISMTLGAIALLKSAIGGEKVLLVSNSFENSKRILDVYCTRFFDTLCGLVDVPRKRVDQARTWVFDNGGELRCVPATKTTSRSFEANFILFDEFAHVEGEARLDEKLYEAATPAIAQGGSICIVSTPAGTIGKYFEIWTSRDVKDEHRLTIHWTECPLLRIREETLPYGKQY